MTLQVLVVDDEPLARSRLKTLLAACDRPPATAAGEAGNASEAMALLRARHFDAVLLDIHMPGTDGLSLARSVRELPEPPAIVFVTAHAQHAVSAFDVEALDYLTKPVRLERLQVALQKVVRRGAAAPSADVLLIQERGRTERVPIAEVLYLKAELKYVTVRTAEKSLILDASLAELEERHAAQFVRVHRNALVSRNAIRALEKHDDPEEGEGWAVRLAGIEEVLAVSRRQLNAVREAMGRQA